MPSRYASDTLEVFHRLFGVHAGLRPVHTRGIQLAGPGDPVDDVTHRWPADRTLVELGTLRLSRIAANEDEAARRIGFLPTHLVDGIEPPADPLLAARGDVYKAAFAERN